MLCSQDSSAARPYHAQRGLAQVGAEGGSSKRERRGDVAIYSRAGGLFLHPLVCSLLCLFLAVSSFSVRVPRSAPACVLCGVSFSCCFLILSTCSSLCSRLCPLWCVFFLLYPHSQYVFLALHRRVLSMMALFLAVQSASPLRSRLRVVSSLCCLVHRRWFSSRDLS